MSSAPARARFTRHALLALLAMVLAALALPAQAGTRVALVIGNAAYENENPLRNPVHDAALIAQTLRSGLKFDEVIELNNLTRRGMIDAIQLLAQKAKGSDTIVVYYSGHGMQGADGNYLIPVDARITAPAHVRREGIPASDITEILNESGAQVALLVLDACRDIPFNLGTRSGAKGLARMNATGGNLLIAYATQEGETADDGSGQHSPYAQALARHLARADLGVLEVFDEVANDVWRQTGKQRPTRYGDLAVSRYLQIVPAKATAAGMGTLAASASAAAERTAWDAARGGGVGAIEAYLGRFPNGKFSALAQLELQRLAAQGTVAPSSPQAGLPFRDCDICPDMVPLPANAELAAFAIAKTEITQAQWQAVMNSNPSEGKACGPQCPVDKVSWNDAQLFVAGLSKLTGKTYRLPTETEWEYACLAGQETEFCGGNDKNAVAWHGLNSGVKFSNWGNMIAGAVSAVRLKRANAFGLHDMSGNVMEWTTGCWKGDCGKRVLRGGSWLTSGEQLDARARGWIGIDVHDMLVGLRVVCASLPK